MRWREYPEYKDFPSALCQQIPRHWKEVRLKNMTRFGYGGSLATDDRIPGCVDVYGSNGVVGQHNVSNTEGPCVIVGRKGSFGKVTYSEKPCFAIDTTYYIDSTQTKHDLRWVYYCLKWLRLDSISRDSAVPGLAREDAYEHVVPWCDSGEQRTIAAFLDRQMERIDSLIEKKQRQIELLQEKRAALINRAVTKGLNSGATMKDSGIEWLGRIPEHWDLRRLKLLTPEVTVGIVITPSKYYVESGVPCLRSLNVREDELTEADLVFISPESNEFLRKSKLGLGDLVSVRTGQPGTTAVVDERFDGANCVDLIIIRNSETFDSRFMCYGMNSELSKTQYLSGTSGAIQPHFNIETAGNMLVTVPPVAEQLQIRRQLDIAIDRIRALCGRITASINGLREYRIALISAAVTGKIDVRREAEV